MAQKKFKQNFARDFKGIDGLMSALEDDDGAVNRAVNYEYAVSNSLRGRVGCQNAGNPGSFYGIFGYKSPRTTTEYKLTYGATTLSTSTTGADGAIINRLIAINQQVWTLDTYNFAITNASGSTATFSYYTYVSGSNINLVIKKGSTTILDTSLGDGVSTFTSIWSLLDTINALADLSVSRTTRGTCPPFAISTGVATIGPGASVTYGLPYTLDVVNTPHNFYPGDIITFPVSGGSALNGGFVIARTNTTITYVGIGQTPANGAVLGYMGQCAANIPIAPTVSNSVANGASFNLAIPYWRLILEGGPIDSTRNFWGPFYWAWNQWSQRSSTNFYTPPVAQNLNGALYIPAGSGTLATSDGFTNNLIKTDGQTVVRAGLPKANMTVALAAGVGALVGDYKYKAYLKRIDAQGNIVEGTPSDVQTITYAAGAGTSQGTVSSSLTGITFPTGFQARGCFKNTAETTAAAFLVDDNAGNVAFMQPGDPVAFLDNTTPVVGRTGVGVLYRSVVSAYDGPNTTITIADPSGAYTIPNNSPISTGLTMVFLRTTAGGNTYYELAEVPITGYATFSFTDNVADAVLTTLAEYIEVDIGKEHDPPPACSIACQHQGGLVVARGISLPNTISFSSADGPEYFPLASNSFDIPSSQIGSVTAIASDTNDRLAVFKEKSYYDVVGDLDSGVFSINIKNEGDYGVTSHASIARVDNTILGLSKNGYVVVSDGNLLGRVYKDLGARLINQDYRFNHATAINDSTERRYICCIPTSTAGSPITHVIDYSRDSLKTFEYSYATYCDMSSGMAEVGGTFYHLSAKSPYTVMRRLQRFNGDSPTSNNGDSFIDNTSAISYILESNVINNGEPDILNTPIRIRVWSIPNDYILDGWVTFSVLVEGGASPIATYIGSGNPGGTSSTLTFSTTNDIFKDIKLVQSVKTHFYIVRFTTNTIRTAPFITGYDILYAENYNPEDLVK